MGREIHIKQGRHPLLPAETCVPLDFDLGGGLCGVVITGPNTGGKTVAEKTVGLLCMMAQCGLHIPAEKTSRVCMRNAYLADIGDGQSISENLSTFSAHITNIKSILETATKESFVILDELGSGTDPAEGMGIAAAVLEELVACGCLFLVTTHYPEIKGFAEKAPGILNARMAFDKENLRPLYRLELGVSGESAALYIAKRLGLSSKILRRAWAHAYQDKAKAPAFLEDLNDVADNVQKGSKRAPAMVCDAPPKEAFDAGFSLGDSVQVLPQKEIGIVFAPKKPNPGPGEEGLVGVQVKDVKKWISHKRPRLHVAASQLYPPGYDFSILFDTVKNRKARHKMEKGHQEGLTVVQDPDYPQ